MEHDNQYSNNESEEEDYESAEERRKYSFICITCGRKYETRYTLYIHVRNNHSEVSELIYKCFRCKKTYRSHNANFIQMHLVRCRSRVRYQNFKCPHCSKEFKHRFHLTQHINRSHTKKNCEICNKTFESRSILIQHIHKKHIQRWDRAKIYECAHCGDKYDRRSYIVKHLRKAHRSKKSFECIHCSQTFETSHKLYLHSCKKLASENDFECAICSKKHDSHTNLMLHLETNHTIKMAQSYEMNIEGDNSKYHVQVITGTNNIDESPTPSSTETIDENLPSPKSSSDTDDEIFNQMELVAVEDAPQAQNNVDESNLSDLECDTDISADENEFQEDTGNKSLWISNTKNLILYFKKANSCDRRYPHLDYEDFILITMNEEQERNLKKFGNDVVLVDRTEDFNSYEFEMTAVMVLDDFRQGVSTTFMFSNRIDEYVYEILYSEIQKKVGRLKPKVFMTDKTSFYYSAWEKVMEKPDKRLFCTWYVSQDWKENLSKVEGDNYKKTNVYARLIEMQTEMNCAKFHKLLMEFVTNKDADLKEFLKYFETYYAQTFTSWAYCYRQYSGINTNTYTKQLFSKIRKIYLRLDYAKLQDDLEVIQLILENFFYEESVKSKREKVIEKIEELKGRHEESKKENPNSIVCIENGWIIPPDKNGAKTKTFDKYLVQPYVQNCGCKLRCIPCDACMHQYKCSCIDYSVEYNFCKHVHLICQLIKVEKMIGISSKKDTEFKDKNDIHSGCRLDAQETKIRKQENGLSITNGSIFIEQVLDTKFGAIIKTPSLPQPSENVQQVGTPCGSRKVKDALHQFNECVQVFDINPSEQKKQEMCNYTLEDTYFLKY